jgi:hypothetical protein
VPARKRSRIEGTRQARSRTTPGLSLLMALAVGACSSPSTGNYPSRSAAIATSLDIINQYLGAIGYVGPRAMTQTEGICHESDDAHGALSISEANPAKLTNIQYGTLLGEAQELWRQAGYNNISSSQEPDGTRQVTANDGAYTLAIYAGNEGGNDNGLAIFVYSCYSTPGPTTETTTQTTMPPLSLSGGSPIASSVPTGTAAAP